MKRNLILIFLLMLPLAFAAVDTTIIYDDTSLDTITIMDGDNVGIMTASLLVVESSASVDINLLDNNNNKIYDVLTQTATVSPHFTHVIITPAMYQNPGNYTITVTVTGATGSIKSDSLKLEVKGITPLNNPPVIVSIASTSVNENSFYSYQVVASDLDNDALTYELTQKPSWISIDSNGLISGTAPSVTQDLNYVITVRVSDGKDFATQTFVLGVVNVPQNSAPVLASIGNKIVNENNLLSFVVSASDADNDVLTYSASQNASFLPTGATFNATSRTFSWTPGFTQSGVYNVIFSVSDGKGGVDSETVTITVLDVNRAPVLNFIGPRSVSENSLLSFVVSASDADNDVLTYSASQNASFLPTGATFNATSRTFSWTPGFTQSGVYNVIFSVSDGKGGVDSETVTITVLDVNRAPVLNFIGPRSVSENSLLSFVVSASDADNDVLIYGASIYNTSFLPAGAIFNATSRTFSWTPSFTQSGEYNITFYVIDGKGGVDSETVIITVNDVNRAPLLSLIGAKNVNEGILLDFIVSASDSDNDVLIYSASGLPTGAIFNATSRTFSWTPGFTQSGEYDVTFSVTDGKGGFDSETVTITVLDVPNIEIINSDVEGMHYVSLLAMELVDGTSIINETSSVVESSVNDSYVTRSDLLNSTITGSILIDCYIENSLVKNYMAQQCVIINSFVDPNVQYTLFNVTITDSIVLASNISYSNISGSNITNSTIEYSDVSDSVVSNSSVENSIIISAGIYNSEIIGSYVIRCDITNSYIQNSSILNHSCLVENAIIIDNVLISGNITINNITFTAPPSINLTDIFFRPAAALVVNPTTAFVNELVSFDASLSRDFGVIVDYKFDFGDGNVTNGINSVVTHSYSVPGTYVVTLNVTDNDGDWDTDIKTITVIPPQISITNVVVIPGLDNVTIIWDTVGLTDSNLYINGTLVATDLTLTTSHSLFTSGLVANTSYDYLIDSSDSYQTENYSGSFTTLSNIVVPVSELNITNVVVVPTNESVTIVWNSDVLSNSELYINSLLANSNSTFSLTHNLSAYGLASNTTYNYMILSGNGTVSGNFSGSFTTLSNVVVPVSELNITNVVVVPTNESVVITWDSDVLSNSELYINSLLANSNSTFSLTHNLSAFGLASNTTYNYMILSGNGTVSANVSGSFTTLSNIVIPVSELNITNVVVVPTNNSVAVAWNTDILSDSKLYINGMIVANDSTLRLSHFLSFTGLVSNTTYNYVIESTNGTVSGNFSGSFTTLANSIPPVVSFNITNVVVVPTNNSVVVTWDTDVLSDSNLYINSVLVASNNVLTLNHSLIAFGLVSNTTYNYAIESNNGVVSVVSNGSFTTLANAPLLVAPIANAGSDMTVFRGEAANFDGSLSTDSDGIITTYSWNFGDGNVGSGITTSNTYSSVGVYVVMLTVTDNDGLTDNDSVVVTVVEPPYSATIVGPESIIVPNDVTLQALVSGGYAPYSYYWDLGDGHTTTGANVTHNYKFDGDYKVILYVTDANGNTVVAEKNIHARAKAFAASARAQMYVSSEFVNEYIANGEDTLKLQLKLQNNGFSTLKGTRITISVPDLGYIRTYTAGNIGVGDTFDETYLLEIPELAYTNPGEYMLRISVYSDSGDVKRNKYMYFTLMEN